MSNQIGSLRMGQKLKKTPAGEIPVDWEARELGDLCVSNPEYGANVSAIEFQEGLPRYVRITDINDNGTLTRDGLKAIQKKDAEGYQLRDGEIIFARTGATVGKTYLYHKADGPCAFAGYTIRFKPNSSYLLPEFLFQFTHSNFYYQWVKGMLRAGAQPNINGSEYSGLILPVPPIKEQDGIVGILSSVDALVSKISEEIEKTKELKKRLTRQLLTSGIGHEKFTKTKFGEIPADWSVATFQEVFDFLRTANNSREDLSSVGEVGYLHYGDIHTKWRTKLDCNAADLPRIAKAKVEGIPFLQNGDIVLADASEDYDGIGVSVEVSNITNQRIVAGLHTMLLRDKARRFVDGFRGYIQYMPIVRQGLIKAGTGVSVYSISKGNLRDIHISIPPFPEQKKITAILQGLDETIERAAEKLDKTVDLKTSLMNMLLAGKVRVS